MHLQVLADPVCSQQHHHWVSGVRQRISVSKHFESRCLTFASLPSVLRSLLEHRKNVFWLIFELKHRNVPAPASRIRVGGDSPSAKPCSLFLRIGRLLRQGSARLTFMSTSMILEFNGYVHLVDPFLGFMRLGALPQVFPLFVTSRKLCLWWAAVPFLLLSFLSYVNN